MPYTCFILVISLERNLIWCNQETAKNTAENSAFLFIGHWLLYDLDLHNSALRVVLFVWCDSQITQSEFLILLRPRFYSLQVYKLRSFTSSDSPGLCGSLLHVYSLVLITQSTMILKHRLLKFARKKCSVFLLFLLLLLLGGLFCIVSVLP